MEKAGNKKTLTEWLIHSIDGEAYRAGRVQGRKHPDKMNEIMEYVGGSREFLRQVRELEQDGLIEADWRDVNTVVGRLHYSVDIMPELCRRAGVEDPRQRQLRYLSQMSTWKWEVQGTFLESYYEEIIERLQRGKEVKEPDLEDVKFFRCLNAIVKLKSPVWKRVFSVFVFGKSKTFEKKYESRILKVLRKSPLSEAEMTDDETLNAHGILTYTQTIEWKGPLQYQLDDEIIDSSPNKYGTVLNAQTLERAMPYAMPGVRQIMLIENKTNYENEKYRSDTLYIFCHGFFSPKEVRFLKEIIKIAEDDAEYLHWGDMDYGGIRIFQFNQEKIFPELKPCRMDRENYYAAVKAGAGISIDSSKKEKLEKMDAGDLEELKQCILENEMEIEQEVLLAKQIST